MAFCKVSNLHQNIFLPTIRILIYKGRISFTNTNPCIATQAFFVFITFIVLLFTLLKFFIKFLKDFIFIGLTWVSSFTLFTLSFQGSMLTLLFLLFTSLIKSSTIFVSITWVFLTPCRFLLSKCFYFTTQDFLRFVSWKATASLLILRLILTLFVRVNFVIPVAVFIKADLEQEVIFFLLIHW